MTDKVGSEGKPAVGPTESIRDETSEAIGHDPSAGKAGNIGETEERKFKLSDYKYGASSPGTALRRRLTIPEGRPGPDTFFRVDPRPEMQLDVCILEFKPVQDAPAEVYLVIDAVASELGAKAKPATIRVCVCRPNIVRIWAVKVPNTGRPNGYIQTAWEASRLAETKWLRLESNEAHTGYDVIEAETQWPDPEWPSESLEELVERAFADRLISSVDHEVLLKLRGRE